MNRDKLRDALNSPQFDEADRVVIFWLFHFFGDFRTALWEAICRADEENLERLRLGFPNEVEGYKRWTRGNLGQRFRDFGLEV